jgi:myo-inositol-1(or 4)-monophosphatase
MPDQAEETDSGAALNAGGISLPNLGAMTIEVAEAIGSFVVEERPVEFIQHTKTSVTDIATQMDAAAEAMARRMITDRRPGDGILGEEGTNEAAGNGLTWIVDPIDGTTNYMYGLPAWSVSVAVMHEGRTVAGCVCAVELDMTVFAVLGGGAWMRYRGTESRLAVSGQSDLSRSLIGTGFGYGEQRRASQGQTVAGILPHVRDIRRAGAASIDLCWVAAGRLDGYYERGLHSWDFAAGALIIEEAGGIITTMDGRTLWAGHDSGGDPSREWDTIVAAGPGIHANLIQLIKSSAVSSRPRLDEA